MGYIYLITNKINGKKYIGQSKCDDINKRWKQHKSYSTRSIGSYLMNAYKKHGIENFIFKIICICFDEDCDIYEKEYIKKYDTIAPNGYNLTPGGHCGITHPDSIEKMRESVKKSWTEERRKEMSIRISGENAPNYGKKTSDEQKEKLRKTSKQYWENMSKEEYQRICKERKERFKNASPSDKILNFIKLGSANKLRKPIGKYDTNGTLLDTFDSISDASKQTGISLTTISKVCQGKEHYKTAGGFVWKYI
jgi:group I intron endonuclease